MDIERGKTGKGVHGVKALPSNPGDLSSPPALAVSNFTFQYTQGHMKILRQLCARALWVVSGDCSKGPVLLSSWHCSSKINSQPF